MRFEEIEQEGVDWFIWLMIGEVSGYCKHGIKASGFINAGDFMRR
jgi:hypothetical protein